MKTKCPHCQIQIEIDPETLATLQGHAHFQCPSCDGLVPVPPVTRTPVKVAAAAIQPSPSLAAGRPSIPSLASAHQGLNRNFLILGAVALLVLGGIGFYLASQKSGDTNTVNQNIRQEIINNAYFQNLIASGATTRKDLEAMAVIRPYENGFIGVSQESLEWPQALIFARKAGGEVLEPGLGGTAARDKLMAWLAGNLAEELVAPVWVQESGQARILDGVESIAVTGTDRPRKFLVHWFTDGSGAEGGNVTTYSADDPWRGFDPGPLVFEDSMTKLGALDMTNFVEGQYSSSLEIISGVGLRIHPGHTWSMVWPDAVLGNSCRFEFEVEPTKDHQIAWVMKGSGTGNSINTGIGFFISRDELIILREGSQWMTKKLPSPLEEGKSVTVRTDIRDAHIAVRINGTMVVSGSANEGLSGQLHGWCGISGMNCIYRNLRVWSSEKDQTLQRQLTPLVTVAPRPNGGEIFNFTEPDAALGQGWDLFAPECIHTAGGAIYLSSYHTSSWPRVIPKKEFANNFAVEFVHQFPEPQTHNLGFFIARAPTLPQSLKDVDEIWQVSLPEGDGTHKIRCGSRQSFASQDDFNTKWFLWGGPTSLLASNAYYAPIQNREYRIRIEWMVREIRVFVDGGLLLEAKRPENLPISDSPTWIGFGQFYSSSRIKELRVFQLPGNE